MNKQQLSRIQNSFTGVVIIITWALLLWQYFNGGVPSHHLLHRADLPAISNWWGAALLPALSWFLLGYIHTRILEKNQQSSSQKVEKYPWQLVIGFVSALLYGGLIATFFVFGQQEISGVMFQGILVLALFFRVYRAQYILGFILSMSFAFGAVLPTMFGLLIALVSAAIFHLVHFAIAVIRKRLVRVNNT